MVCFTPRTTSIDFVYIVLSYVTLFELILSQAIVLCKRSENQMETHGKSQWRYSLDETVACSIAYKVQNVLLQLSTNASQKANGVFFRYVAKKTLTLIMFFTEQCTRFAKKMRCKADMRRWTSTNALKSTHAVELSKCFFCRTISYHIPQDVEHIISGSRS